MRVDRVICLGDVATLGPRPAHVLDRLMAEQIPCVLGNHDAFLIEPDLLGTYTEVPAVVDSVRWCQGMVRPEHLDFVHSFAGTMTVPLDGGRVLQLYHGVPASHMTDLLATHTDEEIDGFLRDLEGDVFAGGHTHIQMLRQHRGKLVINPGSVGMPFEEYVGGQVPTLMRHAEYAIVEGDKHGVGVSLRRVEVDLDVARAHVEATKWPLQGYLRGQYAE